MTSSETLIRLLEPRSDLDQLILEDDTPLDSFYNEKQQRLLAIVFYTSVILAMGMCALACANVALVAAGQTPLAPDMFLSLDVTAGPDWLTDNVRSYVFSEFGKPPDVVIEVISPTKGGELTTKKDAYARYQIPYYAVYNPLRKGRETLEVFALEGNSYRRLETTQFPNVGLGLTLWYGEFEGVERTWLRWCYPDGSVLPTPQEIDRIKSWELAQQAAQHEAELAEKEAQLATKEAEKQAQLAAKEAEKQAQLAAKEAEKQAELAAKEAEKQAQLASKEAEKQAQLAAKEAELAAKDAQYQQLLLMSIELALKMKFPDASSSLLQEISAIKSSELLQLILTQIPTVNTIAQLQQLYQI